LFYVLNSLFLKVFIGNLYTKVFVFSFIPIFNMLGYAFAMHEHLYGCLWSNKSYDMSKKGHIVHMYNKNTMEV